MYEFLISLFNNVSRVSSSDGIGKGQEGDGSETFLRTEHVIGTDHETCQEQGLWTESVIQYQNQM